MDEVMREHNSKLKGWVKDQESFDKEAVEKIRKENLVHDESKAQVEVEKAKEKNTETIEKLQTVEKKLGVKLAERKPLPYPLHALEPFISEKTMKVHYEKHHKNYVDKYNELLAKANKAIEEGDHLGLT
jgi:Fe-Mn family superoxide dismutase